MKRSISTITTTMTAPETAPEATAFVAGDADVPLAMSAPAVDLASIRFSPRPNTAGYRRPRQMESNFHRRRKPGHPASLGKGEGVKAAVGQTGLLSNLLSLEWSYSPTVKEEFSNVLG